MYSNDLSNNQDELALDNEINVNQIFLTLLRNKGLITVFTILGVFVSGYIAFSQKRVWQGEFQIVLDSNESIEKSQLTLGGFAGLGGQNDKLQTEVGILKSPSLLINIFDFVKEQKSINNDYSLNDIRFNDWKKNSLDITLQKGTTILDLAYRDNDKSLILPVLNKISGTYQEYSGKKRTRQIELGIDYFKKQLAIYKEKSVKSLRAAQQFAIDQDLTFLKGDSEINQEIPNYINVEKIRIEAATKIRVINEQLDKIEDLKDDPTQIMYVASTIEGLNDEGLPLKLKEIDSQLERNRLVFTENDSSIQDLLKERSFLIRLLKRQVKGFLIAQRENAQARLISADRPKGVLIKYRQLLSESAKDKNILDKLENQYRAILLEEARSEDPWELITKPTLLPHPIAPKRKKLLQLGFLSGLVLGSGVALIYDKRKNIIYSILEISQLVKWPLLLELPKNKSKAFYEDIDLFISGQLSKTDGSIGLLTLGKTDQSLVSQVSNYLKKGLSKREVIINQDIREVSKYENIIILITLGITNKEEIINANKKLALLNKNVFGCLIINK